MSEQVPLGIYKHYKGGFYRVLGMVRNEPNWELMVRYKPVGGGEEIVRRLTVFTELVDTETCRVPRFIHLPLLLY